MNDEVYFFPINAAINEATAASGFLEFESTGHPYIAAVGNPAARKIRAKYYDPNSKKSMTKATLDLRNLKFMAGKNQDAKFLVLKIKNGQTISFEVD